MKLKKYIALTLSQYENTCMGKVDMKMGVEFDIGLDNNGDVSQGSPNRVRFTISDVEQPHDTHTKKL